MADEEFPTVPATFRTGDQAEAREVIMVVPGRAPTEIMEPVGDGSYRVFRLTENHLPDWLLYDFDRVEQPAK